MDSLFLFCCSLFFRFFFLGPVQNAGMKSSYFCLVGHFRVFHSGSYFCLIKFRICVSAVIFYTRMRKEIVTQTTCLYTNRIFEKIIQILVLSNKLSKTRWKQAVYTYLEKYHLFDSSWFPGKDNDLDFCWEWTKGLCWTQHENVARTLCLLLAILGITFFGLKQKWPAAYQTWIMHIWHNGHEENIEKWT